MGSKKTGHSPSNVTTMRAKRLLLKAGESSWHTEQKYWKKSLRPMYAERTSAPIHHAQEKKSVKFLQKANFGWRSEINE
jgi:hypothetical protein